MRQAGWRRRGRDPLQSGWAQGMAATPGGGWQPSALAAGEINRADCSERHSRTGRCRSARQSSDPVDRQTP